MSMRTTFQRYAALAVSFAALMAVPFLARANHVDLADPDDVQGVLDLRDVTVASEDGYCWRTVTFERWTVERIYDRGFATLLLDTFGGTRPDYYALVRSDGSRMEGDLVRDRKIKKDTEVATLAVYRTGKRSVTLCVPMELTRSEDRVAFNWHLVTQFTSPRCPQVCLDRVPDVGVVEELRPDAVPTPSPTPTATAAP